MKVVVLLRNVLDRDHHLAVRPSEHGAVAVGMTEALGTVDRGGLVGGELQLLAQTVVLYHTAVDIIVVLQAHMQIVGRL